MRAQSGTIDRTFTALADATRRGILERVGSEDASMSDLADRFEMSLTGVAKHVRVLERAGLVATRKVGRVRTVTVGRHRLEDVAHWIAAYRSTVEARLDRLDALLERMQSEEGDDPA